MSILLRNNSGNRPKAALIDGFVIRTKPFKSIFQELSQSNSNKPEQNYLIIGPRGAGKTTLLFRLKYEIEDRLSDWNITPIMFSEEQYNISDLADLWRATADLLADAGYFVGLSDAMQQIAPTVNEEENLFSVLESRLRSESRKLVLFIENIDSFFKKIGIAGQKRLREVLMTSKYIRTIASATHFFEGVTDYSKPFYGFFKTIELKGLSKAEAKDLLLQIGKEYGQLDKIRRIIQRNPKRLEALRRLTGGVPRTISYLFDIFLDNQNGKAIKDLYTLIDDLTFLYKSELDQLSPQQQKIIDIIARNWDAIEVKEIVQKTRIESKQVSSVLQTLEKNQVIEKVNTSSKNNLYRIKERFMNIWYLMRFGKLQDKENVIWLVRFYDTWCSKSELTTHVKDHLKNLDSDKYDLTAALYMGKTFMTCENISNDMKYSIYKSYIKKWPKKSIDVLRLSDEDLYAAVREKVKQKKHQEAIDILEEEIVEKGDKYYNFLVFVYVDAKNYIKAEELSVSHFELSVDKAFSAFRVGILNEIFLENQEKALTYYKIALEHQYYEAAYNIGSLYHKNENDDMALQYFLQAANNEITKAYMPIATIYYSRKKYDLAEEFCQKAVDSKIYSAHLNLGTLSELKGNYEQAESSYCQALANGVDNALIYLGRLHLNKPERDIQRAIDYLLEARKKKVPGSAAILGEIYLKNVETEEQGVQLLSEEAVKEASAAHTLGHYFAAKRNYIESDRYFEQAVSAGMSAALLCYSEEVFDHGREERKEHLLNLFRQHLDTIETAGAHAKLEYANLLLWNDKLTESQEVFNDLLNTLPDIFENELEKLIEDIQEGLIKFFILLIGKGYLSTAKSYFKEETSLDLKQIIKPVYFALMYYLKSEFPREYLKAGDELKDTIEEIIEAIESFRSRSKKKSVKQVRNKNN